MSVNRGKQFETIIKSAFENVPDTAVVRLHDQTMGYLGAKNPCDFIVYHEPYIYFIECKTIRGNTFPLSNITDYQYSEMLKVSEVKGVIAGVICWWTERDMTRFIRIKEIENLKNLGYKSIRFDEPYLEIAGHKKRILFDYDMDSFFHIFEKCNRRK